MKKFSKFHICHTVKKVFFTVYRLLYHAYFSFTVCLLLTTLFLSTLHLLLATFAYSQSGWGPDVRLTYFPGYSYDPKAACNGDTIHLVWWEGYVVSGNIREEVFYKRSTDAGETWGADVLLSVEDTQSSALPQVAVSNNAVHVIWAEDDFGILYRRSFDGGTTWQNIDSIVPGMGYSSIQAFGDTIYICGVVGSTADLRFTKSVDGGNNWEPAINIAEASANPTLRNISNNVLELVVSYRGFPNVEVYEVLSSTGGQIWFDSMMVSENDGIGSQHPAMDTDDSSGIHITWYDYKYSPYPWTGDIFYRASRDSGNTWELIDSLTVQHRAVASDILAEGNNLHLVWEDDRNGFDDNFEIYYRMSTDLGQTWALEERLTNAINWSRRPSLAGEGQYLHLFWFDLRDDPNNIVGEIYYKRKTLTGIQETATAKSLPPGLSLDCPTILRKKSLIRYDLDANKEGEINLIDVTGRIIKIFPVHQISGEFVLNLNKEVPDGVYFIMLKAGKKCVIKKVVKMQ